MASAVASRPSGTRVASLEEIWSRGDTALGASCKVPSTLTSEALAHCGFDYVYIDQQHGVLDGPIVVAMIQSIVNAGAAPIVRVLRNEAEVIGQVLDYGAHGVIVPLIESVDEARRAIAAFHYPPTGTRSHGLLRDATTSGEVERAACILLVEGRSGVDCVEEIAALPGVDAIMIGPQDLALSLGLRAGDPWTQPGALADAVARIRQACAAHGVVAGIGTGDSATAAAAIEAGFRLVNVGNDLGHLRNSARSAASELESLRRSEVT